MKQIALWVVSALVFGFVGLVPAADPTELINYQGVLRGNDDAPLNGDFPMSFRLFNVDVGGTAILEDCHDLSGTACGPADVTVTKGLFNVALGSGSVTDGPGNTGAGSCGAGCYDSLAAVFRDFEPVYLEVVVGGEVLTPRVQVVSAGFALNADHLDGLDSSDFVDTSATAQTKAGNLGIGGTLSVTGHGSLGSVDTSVVDFGPGGADDLTAADVTALTDGGFADALHTHVSVANAGTLDGNDSTFFINTSAMPQTKTGTLTLNPASGPALVTTGGNVGIGTSNPSGITTPPKLMVDGGHLRVRSSHTSDQDGTVHVENFSGSTTALPVLGTYGVWSAATSDGAEGKYGVLGAAAGEGGTKYGVHGSASGAGTNWAGYFVGDTYVQDDLSVGTTSPSGITTTPKLMVDGGHLRVRSSHTSDQDGTVHVENFSGSTTMLPVLGTYGVWSAATSDGAEGKYGVLGAAAGEGGTKYGVHASASGAGTNWAGYFVGNTYVQDDLGVGTTDPSAKLDVVGTTELNGDVEVSGKLDIDLQGELRFGSAGAFGDAIGFDFNVFADGLILEQHQTESAGAYFDGDYISLWAPGDQDRLLRLYDEDGMIERFWIDGDGDAFARGVLLTSSRSKKQNIEPLHGALDKLRRLQGVSFEWNDEPSLDPLKGLVNGEPGIGFIAEDVAEIFPELVTWNADGETAQALNYSSLTAVVVEAVKELHSLVAARCPELDVPGFDEAVLGGSVSKDGERQGDPGVAAESMGGSEPPAATHTPLPVDGEGNVYARSFQPSDTELANLLEVDEPVERGDVLVINAQRPGRMSMARTAGDTAVLGVVAGKAGLVLGAAPPESGAPRDLRAAPEVRLSPDAEVETLTFEAPVVFSGIVMTKVDAGYGALRPGDLLTTSPTPGHAMRADHPLPGAILGKALEPLDAGTGLIKVLVTLR